LIGVKKLRRHEPAVAHHATVGWRKGCHRAGSLRDLPALNMCPNRATSGQLFGRYIDGFPSTTISDLVSPMAKARPA
jgi:hypothetical protein